MFDGGEPKENTRISEFPHKRKKKSKQTNLCSLTGVNPPRTHGFGVWNNPRVVMGVRVDEKLYQAFKPVAKAVFGSVCRPIESFMATVVATYQAQQANGKLGVNPSNTIEIGKLVIERNVRTRRRMVVEEKEERTSVTVGNKPCEFSGCRRLAEYQVFFYDRDDVALYCRDHFHEAKGKRAYRELAQAKGSVVGARF